MSTSFKGKISQGVKWSFIGTYGGQIVGFLISIFLARLLSPEDFGIASATFEDISAQSSEESLRMVQEAFAGEKSAVQDMIALNSGAALYIARKVDSISEGVELSFDLMNNGKAADKLAAYVRVSNT